MKMKNNELILRELMSKQIKNVQLTKKLQFSDLKRISKYIDSSIFDENNCSMWNGYITNINNITKGTYVNFYFRKKKVALHRLLYNNFLGDLSEDEYLKFSCENKGKCCNIHHMNKFKYNTAEIRNDEISNKNTIHENKKESPKEIINKPLTEDDFFITFD
jgi:hypothetical protein